tara:strand:+ start:1084 stop:1605 length:522 start_codon:yes stop_codon:yes gene_type:complete
MNTCANVIGQLMLSKPDDNRTYEINITRNEALFMSDSMTRIVKVPDGWEGGSLTLRSTAQSALIVVPESLMIKVGKAIAFLTKTELIERKSGIIGMTEEVEVEINKGKTYSLVLGEYEAWLIWEIAQSYLKVGDAPVGYDIKKKLARVMYGEDVEFESVAKLLDDVNMEGFDN